MNYRLFIHRIYTFVDLYLILLHRVLLKISKTHEHLVWKSVVFPSFFLRDIIILRHLGIWGMAIFLREVYFFLRTFNSSAYLIYIRFFFFYLRPFYTNIVGILVYTIINIIQYKYTIHNLLMCVYYMY